MKQIIALAAFASATCFADRAIDLVGPVKGTAVVCAEQAGRRVVVLDSAAAEGYVWEWKPESDRKEVAAMASRFSNPSDIRPKAGGKLLVISSGGAFARIDMKSRKADYAGFCSSSNPHSIEELPGGCVATASSDGGSVMIIDPRANPFDWKKQKKKKVLNLKSAHGVVWDERRKSLWAIGATEIVEMEYLSADMDVKVKSRHDFVTGGCGKWGHDLVLGDDGNVYFTTHDTVSVFLPDTRSFKVLSASASVKSVSFGKSGEIRCVARTKWWTDRILVGEKETIRSGAKFYKARYL